MSIIKLAANRNLSYSEICPTHGPTNACKKLMEMMNTFGQSLRPTKLGSSEVEPLLCKHCWGEALFKGKGSTVILNPIRP